MEDLDALVSVDSTMAQAWTNLQVALHLAHGEECGMYKMVA
jgi:hypothetical protein